MGYLTIMQKLFRGKPQSLGEGLRRCKEAFGVAAEEMPRYINGSRVYTAFKSKGKIHVPKQDVVFNVRKAGESGSALSIRKNLRYSEYNPSTAKWETEHSGIYRMYEPRGKKSTTLQHHLDFEASPASALQGCDCTFEPYNIINKAKATISGIA